MKTDPARGSTSMSNAFQHERYEPQALLGRGAMGAVWRVLDREAGVARALKTLEPPALERAEARLRFRTEFQTMQALEHPRLARAHAFGTLADGRPFYVMDLLEGPTLEGDGPRSPEQIRTALVDMLEALAYLHGRGWLHGDLKPENMRQRPDGRWVLVDFGLASRSGERAGAPAGTPLYMAPEVLRGEQLDARADLYAAGAVAYHLLAGRPPFEGADARALGEAILTAPLAPLSEVAPGVPSELTGTVMAMIQRSRAQRPASALEALEALGAPVTAVATLPAPAFVGRAGVLSTLQAAVASPPALRTLAAPAGFGGSRALEALAARLELAGTTAYRGAATPGGAPYAALEGFARWLSTRAGAGATAFEAARAATHDLPPRSARASLQAAWLALLEATGLRPVVALFDDWDAADEASRDLLAALAGAPGSPLAAVGAEAGTRGDVVLAPLDAAETGALAASQLGLAEVPAAFAAELQRLSGGSPRLARRILEDLVARGALPREGGRWRPERVDHGMLVVPVDPTAAPLDRLPEDARRLVGALALAYRPLDAAEAGAALGLNDEALAAAVEALAARGLLAGTRLASRELAPTIAAAVEAPRGLHYALASALTGPHDAAARAWHWHGAGEAGRARADAIAAARERLAALATGEAGRMVAIALSAPAPGADAHEVAGDLARLVGEGEAAVAAYDRALALLPAPGPARMRTSRALALQLAGRFDEAIAAAAAAEADARAAGDLADAARAGTTLARLLHFGGKPEACLEACRRAGEAAVTAGDRELEAEALGLAGFLRTRAPATAADGLAMIARSVALREQRGDRLALVDAYLTQGNGFLAVGQLIAADEAFARARAIGRAQGGAGDDEATTLINMGQVRTELGRLDDALAALDEAVRLAAARGNAFLEGYAHGLRSRVFARQGRPGDALREAGAATGAAQALNSAYLAAHANAWQAELLLLMGDAVGALEICHEGLNRAAGLNDPEVDTHLGLVAAEAHVELRSVGPARRRLARLDTSRRDVAAQAGLLEARLAADRGDGTAARHILAGARQAAAEAGLAPVLAQLDLVEAGLAASAGRGREAANAYRRAHQAGSELGLLFVVAAAARGLVRVDAEAQTLALADAARAELEAIQARLPEPLADAFAARWLAVQPGTSSKELAPELGDLTLREVLERLTRPPAPAVSLDAEALSVVSDFGRMVTGTLGYEEVLDRVIDHVMNLAGAERGMIVLVDGEGAFTGMVARPREAAHGGTNLMDFSSTFVRAAMEAGKPIWIADAQADARFAAAASVMALDLRTILCVPLMVEGSMIGLLYVDRSSINRTFDEADLKLVEGLAGFAGLAIANARRYEETRARAAELAAAQALGQLAGGRRALDEVLEAVLLHVCAVVPAERAVLLLGDDPYPTLAIDAGGHPAEAEVSEALMQRVVAARQAMIDRDPEDPVAAAPRQVLAVPLVLGDELLGALYLVRPEDERAFTPRDLDLVETLAGHAAAALDAVATREGLQRQVVRLEDMVASLQAKLMAYTATDELEDDEEL